MYAAGHANEDSSRSRSTNSDDESGSLRSSTSSRRSLSESDDDATMTREGGRYAAPPVPGAAVLGSSEAAGAQGYAIPVPQALTSAQLIENSPNDEVYHIDEQLHVTTPVKTETLNARAGISQLSAEHVYGSGKGSVAGGNVGSGAAGGTLIADNPNDERIDVSDAEVVPTPRIDSSQQRRMGGGGSGNNRQSAGASKQRLGQTSRPHRRRLSSDVDNDDDDDEEEDENDNDDEEEEEEDEEGTDTEAGEFRAEGYSGQRPDALGEDVNNTATSPTNATASINTQLAYDPAKYESINAKASREMQDLFRQIADYQPFIAELPAKLRPFIPDYIPAIGDMDPFVKVGRPDGLPDGLGLYVVDEPTIPQSNPAVVQLELRATSVQGFLGSATQVVDSFEDAANRPQVIDRWIADVKKVHYKKPLPTITYQKPMPEIETLMQVWPQPFEDLLNSDLQLPPSNIDLDMDQYVRTLCSILDIPTYNTLIDPLHVMFTLYEEFRDNQHFQHE